jgi:predicted SprT family Zn-dependent metalloprotease
MELNDAKIMAINLLQEFKLLDSGWYFTFDSAKRRFGCCSYRMKCISLSKYLVLINDEARVKDTILHEIAHALTPGHGHDKVWKAKAIEIGCNGMRCFTREDTILPEPRYVAVCNSCGYVHRKERATKNVVACGHCCKGKFDSRFVLEFKPNPRRNLTICE